MSRRRPVPADHAAKFREFAIDFRCFHVAEIEPAHADAVLALLERSGYYLALFCSEDRIDRAPPTVVFLFCSEPLDRIAAYHTLTAHEVTRYLGDLLRSGRVARVEMAGGVTKPKEISRCPPS